MADNYPCQLDQGGSSGGVSITARAVHLTTRVALMAIGCWSVICAGAQPLRSLRVPMADGADIRFSHFSLETALVPGAIVRILQDDQGFLWFGTTHGLVRYDGYQFRVFVHDPANPNSLSGVNVAALIKDRAGNLWIGSEQQLDRYSPASGNFAHFLSDSGKACESGVVRDITQDREGLIWLATDDGLKRLDPTTSQINCYQHRHYDDLSIGSNLVKSMLESQDGTFWVATIEGLDRFDRRTGEVTRRVTLRGPSGALLKLDGNKISLIEDHAGILWITIPGNQGCGLASFDPRTGVQGAYSFGAPDAIFSILEDQNDTLWFGNGQQGIIKFDRNRKAATRYRNNLNVGNSVSSSDIYTLLQDREHRMWVGTAEGGVDRFDPRPPSFRTYRYEPGNPNSLSIGGVHSVLQDRRGILWLGGAGGLDRINRMTGKVTRFISKQLSSQSAFGVVSAIVEDHEGYVWFGNSGNGLSRFDPRTGGLKFYRHDPDNSTSLSNDKVDSLFVDHAGTLWVGASDALNRFEPETEQFQKFSSTPRGSGQYGAIAEDANGALWLASSGYGLYRFDPTTAQFTSYRNTPADARSVSDDGVNTVYVDHAGTIWAGTNSGLSRFDPSNQKFTIFYERDGLASGVVKGILEDRAGDLWLSTSDGLSRFNPRTKAFRNYYSTDGLPGNEFVQGAASRSSSGEMFFGSTKGLLAFFAEGVIDDSSRPPVVLTDFWLFGNRSDTGKDLLKQSISFARSLTLEPRQNIFSIEFSALSYSDPARNRYRYRLEPLEAQWNERDSTRRLVTYTTLAPRDYVFRVQGSNSLGVWNETGATLRIKVRGFWWTWWWVRTAFIAMLITLLWGLHRLRLHQIAHEFNIRLEARVNERTRIARDLHDTLLQSFQGVLLKFYSLKYLIPDRPTEAVESLEHLVEQARAAIIEGRDAVQGLRSSTVVANDLARAVSTFGGGLAADQPLQKRPEFRVRVEGESRDLPPLVRDEVYHITCESVRNAFRHAQAQRIEVEFRYDSRKFRLRIMDNGKGIDPAVLSAGGCAGHHGLPGLSERAKLAGGKLSVWSQLNSGTEIELTIPAAIAYTRSVPAGRSIHSEKGAE